MKKYYWTYIYQVNTSVGYIKSGAEYLKMTSFKEKNIPCATWTLIYYKKLILVEKICPFLAKEVKTGIIFPILSLTENFSSKIKYKSYPFIPIHTFFSSTKDLTEITYAKPIKTVEELEKYNQMYPDVNELKQELLTIIATGKSNMNTRFMKEKEQLKYEKQQLKNKKQGKRNERLKVRKLQYQFQRERKNIK